MKILLDCDGILADFTTPYLKIIEDLTGFQYKTEDLKNFDYLKALNLECLDKDVRKILYKKGFCKNIPVYPEAIEGFKKLQFFGEIVMVTSPMMSPYWMFERAEWLRENFGIKKDNLIFASRKELVQGDVFIDDKDITVANWHVTNKNLALLFSRPWNMSPINEINKMLNDKHSTFIRINNWNDIINQIEKYKIALSWNH